MFDMSFEQFDMSLYFWTCHYIVWHVIIFCIWTAMYANSSRHSECNYCFKQMQNF